MHRTNLFALLAIGFFSAACQRTEAPLTPASGTRANSALPDGYAPLSDDQIAGAVLAAHSAELQQARIALRRAQRKDVREFARTLIAHSEQALNEGRALESRVGLAPETSASASDLDSSNSELVIMLNDAKRADFDREFVVSQIGNHEEILALLDARLLPEVRNGELRSALEALRPIVEEHLESALTLQQKLQ